MSKLSMLTRRDGTAEFVCIDCGVHVWRIGEGEPRCATCMNIPGWQDNPNLRRIFLADEEAPTAPEKLEPCPFCGGQVKMCQEPYDNGYVAGLYYLYHIWDTDDARSCRLHVSGHFDSREQAISFWNTRPTPSPDPAELIRLHDAVTVARRSYAVNSVPQYGPQLHAGIEAAEAAFRAYVATLAGEK